MNIEKIAELSNEVMKLNDFIKKIKCLDDTEHLDIKISISNFYDHQELDVIQTDKDNFLEDAIVEHYTFRIEKLKEQIKDLAGK